MFQVGCKRQQVSSYMLMYLCIVYGCCIHQMVLLYETVFNQLTRAGPLWSSRRTIKDVVPNDKFVLPSDKGRRRPNQKDLRRFAETESLSARWNNYNRSMWWFSSFVCSFETGTHLYSPPSSIFFPDISSSTVKSRTMITLAEKSVRSCSVRSNLGHN